MKQSKRLITALLVLVAFTSAADQGVIIQGWTPEEAFELNWGDGDRIKDELWNDCFLAYELFCSRTRIDTNPSKIHMLWADGQDYSRRGQRYDPWERLGIHSGLYHFCKWQCTNTVDNRAN